MERAYPGGAQYVCADSGHEWPVSASAAITDEPPRNAVGAANPNVLPDGDSLVLIEDLRVQDSSITLKMGTRVKGIRIGGGDHEIDCRTDAGSFMLKACVWRRPDPCTFGSRLHFRARFAVDDSINRLISWAY